jgi:hypothetical protein
MTERLLASAGCDKGLVMADVQALVADNPIPRSIAEEDALASDPIYAEAKRRFEYCLEVESSAVKHFLDDYRFAEGDSDNGYQWPNDLRKARELSKQPSLTINETRQHNLQIINDAKQNKPGIKIRPTGGQASAEAASICWSSVSTFPKTMSSCFSEAAS